MVPREALRLATKPLGGCWWSMGKTGHEPAMQIVGELFATNIASVPIRIPQVELRYGFLGRKRAVGMVMISSEARRGRVGMFDIPPGETRDASFHFWLFPPFVKETQPFIARSLIFTDQFGNRHRVRRVSFRPITPTGSPRAQKSEEFPYAITDPIEREIVSVLKAELARYEMCGRRVGGLGSVYLTYRGQSFTGVGTDSWTADSPINQVIVADPEAASLNSDNLAALVDFHQGLASGDRARFAATLLDRLDGKRGYLAISYFTCVLWKTGSFPEALEKAKRDLPTGESRVFGLSNVLMLLNGLLKYRHPDFTNRMLDDIERLIHGLDEQAFMIPAKIAAIRASRLSKT